MAGLGEGLLLVPEGGANALGLYGYTPAPSTDDSTPKPWIETLDLGEGLLLVPGGGANALGLFGYTGFKAGYTGFEAGGSWFRV